METVELAGLPAGVQQFGVPMIDHYKKINIGRQVRPPSDGKLVDAAALVHVVERLLRVGTKHWIGKTIQVETSPNSLVQLCCGA